MPLPPPNEAPAPPLSVPDLAVSLARIADALDRLAPPPLPLPVPGNVAIGGGTSFVWVHYQLRAVQPARTQPLDCFEGVEPQKAALLENCRRLAAGLPAHDVLLWGSRGMGKSSLVKAVHATLCAQGTPLALVQVGRDDIASLGDLFAQLATQPLPALVFADDLSFEADEHQYKALRSVLEGGIEARPDNVRVIVTSNRRHLVAREHADAEAANAINARDVLDDRLALADRFGLSLGFHNCDQPTYLAIVAGYARAYGLNAEPAEALAWAMTRGSRSGRVAWQFIQELAGRDGVMLDTVRQSGGTAGE
ncbi:MAG TPA: ATP-binding protein [Polymorphobacter sp.]|nr:ATP-binding protein [Polymorphobacter sp.]